MDISRRTVIGAGAALPLVAATPALAASTSSGPSPADWADLSASMRGSIGLPGSSMYAQRVPLFDPHWDMRRPAALARVIGVDDMAACVKFARDHGLRVTGRSGGHSYVGASARTGTLVIDTRAYARTYVSSDLSETTVRAGANLYSVHKTLAVQGRSLPTGTCPTVGAAGLTLAGGLGTDSRRYGLTIDRLVRATVVDAQGRVLTVDEDHHPDLYWSIRGGGSGTVLVADMTYRTIPATSFGFFNVTFPASRAARVVRLWARWMAEQPRDTWANVHLDTSGSSISVRVFGVAPVGKESARAGSLAKAVGVTPEKTTTTTRTHLAGIEYLGGGSTTPRTRFVAGSDILRNISVAGGEAVEAAIRSAASRGITTSAILDPLDGAVSDLDVGTTAFPWRDHTASIQWYVGLSSGASAGYSAARSWLARAHELLAPHTRGGYIGYIESGRALRDYVASNGSRLTSVRRAQDPENVIV